HGTPAVDGEPDERLALLDHRGPVLVPVGVLLARGGPEVVHEGLDGLGHVEHLGGAVHLDPGVVELVAQREERRRRAPAQVAHLGPLRVRRHHDPTLRVDAVGDGAELGAAVGTRGHEDAVAARPEEVQQLVPRDGGGGGDRGHGRQGTAGCGASGCGVLGWSGAAGASRSGRPRIHSVENSTLSVRRSISSRMPTCGVENDRRATDWRPGAAAQESTSSRGRSWPPTYSLPRPSRTCRRNGPDSVSVRVRASSGPTSPSTRLWMRCRWLDEPASGPRSCQYRVRLSASVASLPGSSRYAITLPPADSAFSAVSRSFSRRSRRKGADRSPSVAVCCLTMSRTWRSRFSGSSSSITAQCSGRLSSRPMPR